MSIAAQASGIFPDTDSIERWYENASKELIKHLWSPCGDAVLQEPGRPEQPARRPNHGLGWQGVSRHSLRVQRWRWLTGQKHLKRKNC